MSIVWIIIFVSIIVISILLRVAMRQERQRYQTCVFVLTFGAFCQQTANTTGSLHSTRCLIIFLFMFSLTVHKIYTTMLFSIIIDPSHETSIMSKEDLANSGLPIGFFNNTSIKNFLKVTIIAFSTSLIKFNFVLIF